MFHYKKRGKKGIYHVFWYEDGKHHSKAISPDLEDVKIWISRLATRLYAKKNGLPIKKYPFVNFIQEYKEEYTKYKAPRTQLKDNSIIKLFTQTCPNIYYIEQFNEQALKEYKFKRLNQTKQPSSINRELGLLKHMQKIAYAKKLLSEDESAKTHFIPLSKNKATYPVTDEDIQRLFDYITEPYTTACILGYAHGMRRGEVCHLEIDDFDFNNNIIKIRNKHHLQWFTKNESSERDVPIHPDYRQHLIHRIEFAKSVGSNLVCCYEDGRPLKEDVLTSMFTKFRKHLKIPYQFHFHSLRHKFITLAGNSCNAFKGISNIVGHTTSKITEAVYYHSSNQVNSRIMNEIKLPLKLKNKP